MAKSTPSRDTPSPEGQVLHLIVDKAVALGMVADLAAVMTAWYRENVDAHGFVAGDDIGPVTPETPYAP